MKALTMALVLSVAGAANAQEAERKPRLEADACSRQTEVCEQACDSQKGMNRLSCKTDCRLAETQCRNGGKK